jgi:hypothetical protein
MPAMIHPQAPISPRPGFRTTRQLPLIESLASAGWSQSERIDVGDGRFESLSWANLRTLAAARDEKLRRFFTIEPDAAMRHAWMQEPCSSGTATGSRASVVKEPLHVAWREPGAATRVLLLGDTGDASQAQRAVALHLAGRAARPGSSMGTHSVAAILIESDIVYPAGAWDEYVFKFASPYSELLAAELPIYAIPGNHDWNDGSLIGFMRTFCGASGVPSSVPDARAAAVRPGWRRLVAQSLWHPRATQSVDAPTLAPSGTAPSQQAPYFALDIGGALFIGIDTGLDGVIDTNQARWLVQLVESRPDVPKLIFSGKPLIVKGARQPCTFTPSPGTPATHVDSKNFPGLSYQSVDDIIRHPMSGFVAAMGGDVHNYERYIAHITDQKGAERVSPYVVCGGGGVVIGQTYWMGEISVHEQVGDQLIECFEAESVLFPTRQHSRLFADSITRRAAKRTRFTLPLGFLAAALITAVWAIACHFVSHPGGPGFASSISLVAAAVAVNISARPITRRGRIASIAFAAAASVPVWWPSTVRGIGGLAAGDVRALITAGLIGGLALLLLGDWLNRPSIPSIARNSASGLAFAALVAAGAGLLLAASKPGSGAVKVVAAIAALSLIVVLALTDKLSRRVTVQSADEAPLRVSRWLAKRQKWFSIYETFTDGRLHATSTLVNDGVRSRVKIPLYRSFLEIEFRQQSDDNRWWFAFTAFAVSGEETSDTASGGDAPAPVVVDAFEVIWSPTSLDISPTAPHASP